MQELARTSHQTDQSAVVNAYRRLEIALSAASLGVWDWNLATNKLVYSDQACAICGFQSGVEIDIADVRKCTHPDDLPRTSELARQALDPGIRSRESYRYRIIRQDNGETRWVVAYGEAIFDDVAGEVQAVRYVGTIQDITDQKRAEDELIESQATLALAIGAGRMAVWEIDLATEMVTHSPELNVLCGFPRDSRPTLAEFRSRYAPGERERISREGQEALARGETQFQNEFRQIWPDGTEKWLLLRAQFAPTSNGDGNRVIGVLMDISDRKAAENQMELIARELQHRVKNSLAVVQTLANQSFRGKADVEDAARSFSGRLAAFAAANDIMTHGSKPTVDVSEILDHVTRAYRDDIENPFIVSGPPVVLDGKLASALGMAIHELCTNAVKYGSLSTPSGNVFVSWRRREDGKLVFDWRERGGPVVVSPDREGFGTKLLKRGLFAGLDAEIDLDFAADGLVCRIVAAICPDVRQTD